MVKGRVIRITGNTYHVETPEGMVACLLTNKVRRDRGTRANKPAAVGDEVEITLGSPGEGALAQTLPRRTKLCRAMGSDRAVEGVLVANADRVLTVFAARAPEPDFRDLERALVMSQAGRMETAIVINKCDLGPPPDLSAYKLAGYACYCTSVKSGLGLDALRDSFAGKTTVLMGPSGVGKSSLLNAIDPSLHQKIGELSRRIDEGRHTTTWVEMIKLASGGYVVDTPGIEAFGLWGIDARDVQAFYPEIAALAPGCRFRDCLHDSEPGCAVKGHVPAVRHEGYLGILRELKAREAR